VSGEALPRNRHAIAGHATRYEVALYRDGAPVTVLAYTARRTRRALLDILFDARDLMQADLARIPWAAELAWDAHHTRLGWPSIGVGFTGRTERDAAMEFEP
jgi:hypothetical protein